MKDLHDMDLIVRLPLFIQNLLSERKFRVGTSLSELLNQEKGVPLLLRLYRALVCSKLDYGCFIYGAACKSYISLLDPILNHGWRLSLGAFRTSPAQSLCVKANELPLHLWQEKLALQFTIEIAANPNPANTNYLQKIK